MKVEAFIFNGIGVFCIIAAVVYGIWSREPIGTTALVLSGGLTFLVGGFFWFVSRRIDARPEDLVVIVEISRIVVLAGVTLGLALAGLGVWALVWGALAGQVTLVIVTTVLAIPLIAAVAALLA